MSRKTAMITGCHGGIGTAAVKRFLSEGWNVCGLDMAPVPEGSGLAECGNYIFARGSLTDGKDREDFLHSALSFTGRIDALVNVAGVAPKVRNDILEMTEESYDRVMEINTKGTFFLTQLVANKMKDNDPCGEDMIRGYICNISSMSAYTSSTSRGEYCISKAGVSMITKLFADRMAEFGIPVNEIRPGIIRTGMTAAVKEKYDRLIGGGLLPIARWGRPEDVAEVIYSLCSGRLPYVTGQSVDVDGGFHIRRL